MSSRNAELRQVLKDAEAQDWRVERGKRGGYYKMYCPCGRHRKTVHLTPRRNYWRNLRAELARSTCWEEQ